MIPGILGAEDMGNITPNFWDSHEPDDDSIIEASNSLIERNEGVGKFGHFLKFKSEYGQILGHFWT